MIKKIILKDHLLSHENKQENTAGYRFPHFVSPQGQAKHLVAICKTNQRAMTVQMP